MPNEVYEAAVEGLSSLVSPRVAKRIIDDSLRATSRTADDVSSTAMRRLLLGRVRSELEGVMPAAAVGPGLVQLAAELQSSRSRGRRPWWRRAGREHHSQTAAGEREKAPSTAAAKSAQVPPTGAAGERSGQFKERRRQPRQQGSQELLITKPEQVGVTRSSVYLPGVDLEPDPLAGQDSGGRSDAGMAAEVVNAGSQPPSADSSTATTAVAVGEKPAVATSRPALPALSAELIERALRVFADLETVKQIVAVRRGEVVQASGTGLDAEKLKGLSVATNGLLSKAGTLRVFSLEHEAGVLFLFPLRDGALVVLTHPKVNIGAVLSARATLEEAA